MKGRFYAICPIKPDSEGFLNYKIMFRRTPESEPFVAKMQKVPTRGMEECIDQAIIRSGSYMHYQVEAANAGLEAIFPWKYCKTVIDANVVFLNAFVKGEAAVQDKKDEIFAKGEQIAKSIMDKYMEVGNGYKNGKPAQNGNKDEDKEGTLVMDNERIQQRLKEMLGDMNPEPKEAEIVEIDFNDPEQVSRASKHLMGDDF